MEPGSNPARERYAAAVRRLIDATAGRALGEELATQTAERLESIAAAMEEATEPRGHRFAELPDPDDLQSIYHTDPVIGRCNPIAPPVDVEVDGATVHGRVTLGRAYEGPPGYAHGAVVAGIFDHLLGMANVAHGTPGMTGRLTIHYRAPTPLEVPLKIECKTARVDGRKIYAMGTLHAGDVLTAEAEGLFVSIGEGKAREYFPHRD